MAMLSYLQQGAGAKGCGAWDGEKEKGFSKAAVGDDLEITVGACLYVHHSLQLQHVYSTKNQFTY